MRSRTTIVASGSMVLGSSGLMKAYLGSCVGVAAIDRRRHMGGLLHVLLPKPLCDVPETQLSSYATTGVPLFLKALSERGASPDELETYVAGGALGESPTREDLFMNIGGRTLEAAMETLADNGVHARILEAGGLAGLCMNLDMDRTTCTIEPIIDEIRSRPRKETPLPTLAEIGRSIENLRPIPQIAIRVSEMLSEDNTDISTVASEIKKDQVLSADVLRLCNSPYLGIHRRVDSIDDAVTILGTTTLLQLVMTAHLERLVGCSENGYSLMRGGLFFHSLAVARLCDGLARAGVPVPTRTAYTAGLLHDIGKVVLDQYMARIQPLFYRVLKTHGEDSSALERSIFGIDHNLAGLHLSEAWGLPASIREAILFHHDPAHATAHEELVHLVHVADTLSLRFLPGLVIENPDPRPIDESMRILGLGREAVEGALVALRRLY